MLVLSLWLTWIVLDFMKCLDNLSPLYIFFILMVAFNFFVLLVVKISGIDLAILNINMHIKRAYLK